MDNDELGDAVNKVKVMMKDCGGLDLINALRNIESDDESAQMIACEITDGFFWIN